MGQTPPLAVDAEPLVSICDRHVPAGISRRQPCPDAPIYELCRGAASLPIEARCGAIIEEHRASYRGCRRYSNDAATPPDSLVLWSVRELSHRHSLLPYSVGRWSSWCCLAPSALRLVSDVHRDPATGNERPDNGRPFKARCA